MSAPKRDKLAAMASRKADKLSSMANREQESMEVDTDDRETVWKDLDQAEAHVIHLLETAQQTADLLSKPKLNQEELEEHAKNYQKTLQQIHDKLDPHAKYVKAYQDHSTDDVYPARLDNSIAIEKEQLIQEWLQDDQEF